MPLLDKEHHLKLKGVFVRYYSLLQCRTARLSFGPIEGFLCLLL